MRLLLQQQNNNHHKLYLITILHWSMWVQFLHPKWCRSIWFTQVSSDNKCSLEGVTPILWTCRWSDDRHTISIEGEWDSTTDSNETSSYQSNDVYTNETITVMTVNQGQSDLLVNFFCAAKSRNLDLHRILVFVTDEESRQLVEGFSKDLGVMVYYDKWNFDSIPKGGEIMSSMVMKLLHPWCLQRFYVSYMWIWLAMIHSIRMLISFIIAIH